ncbi:MAG: leucine--tRNA ligase [Proteobacteria bacterium]|nr:leucine--tRNA ligase [Pseudomonadota bacterium]
MTERYDPSIIEPKWRQRWEETKLYRRDDESDAEKWYFLTMLPYPSGDLHTGHWYAMSPSDAGARYKRMRGYNAWFPIGFDAFGLPAENAAIKQGVHPYKWTMQNIENMRWQLRQMGTMFDWEHEAVSCLPGYYQWTEWFFLKFYDMGLAYREEAPVDFCPTCNTTLAREQVWGDDRHCERCGTPVVIKNLAQWKFRITQYADELDDCLDDIDWPERVKTMQRNWIGRSEGVEFEMIVQDHAELSFRVFTTRPDTTFGMTFAVLAPEHPLVELITTEAERASVADYVEAAKRKSDLDRQTDAGDKTGVFTGAYAINPVNNQPIPIWIADYVLMGYGTGAIMAVPAHDERDFEFARTYDIPTPIVIVAEDVFATGDATAWDDAASQVLEAASTYKEGGVMVNSGRFEGSPWPQSFDDTALWLAEHAAGERKVNYRMHDWLISRQRMWGSPIPIIYCPDCGTVPVPYEDLPVLLPEDAEFRPTGESPLKYHEGFRYVKCPKCGSDAERETDTMDTFLCSSWYPYAYLSPYWKEGETLRADDIPWQKEAGEMWMPVDQYTGGIEHATMHLLYVRFFTKAMRDAGLVSFDEPMLRLVNQGMILGEDGEKMSKSRGNVVNPDDYVGKYGADTVRAFLMFIGPWEQGGPWNPRAIEGVQRFMQRVWSLVIDEPPQKSFEGDIKKASKDLRRTTHQTILKVTEDYENFKFNTMVAALMGFSNTLADVKESVVCGTDAWDEAITTLLLLMAPAMPHVTEELWSRLGKPYSIHQQSWPEGDPELAKEDVVEIALQVNGKVRDRIEIAADADKAELEASALASEKVQKWIAGKTLRKVIVVPGRMVNVVAT